jgi:hypothetical protein
VWAKAENMGLRRTGDDHAMKDHVCDLHYRGVRENAGKAYDLFICVICGREEWRAYTGCYDTIEGRE